MRLATWNVNLLKVRLPRLLVALAARCTACRIDRNARKGEKPSDHVPVIAEISA